MSANRPRVFISSTIYDFSDLRSALRFWLEEMGYQVLSSENNDFPVQADLSSYETCLRAIDDCDYFVLFVGTRVGGLYNAATRISITQTEYRHAYERLKQDRLKLIAFVRSDLWAVREDRSALETLLKSDALAHVELGEDDISRIVNHPSKFANDANHTFDFLREISRNDEMRASIKGNGPAPIGNWIRQFSHFRDIIDALRVEFRIGSNLRRVALLANLRAEIVANLAELLEQRPSGAAAAPKFKWATFARDAITGGIDDSSSVQKNHLTFLSIFALTCCSIGRCLATTALDEAVASGEFLDFNRNNDAFYVGIFQESLLKLQRNIERLRSNEDIVPLESRINLANRFKNLEGTSKVLVQNLDLVPVLAVHDCQINITRLCKAIYRAIDGDTSALTAVQLLADSPLAIAATAMDGERPTPAQIETWLTTD